MGLKVIDGLRTRDGANLAVDICQLVAASVNSTSIDMSNYAELVVHVTCSNVTGSGTGVVAIQESNETAANFTNITNASMSFNTANTGRVHSVDWRKPERKRYARLNAVNATNSIQLQCATFRVMPTKAAISLDGAASQTDA